MGAIQIKKVKKTVTTGRNTGTDTVSRRPVNGSLVRQKIDVLLRVIFLECDSDNPKITIF